MRHNLIQALLLLPLVCAAELPAHSAAPGLEDAGTPSKDGMVTIPGGRYVIGREGGGNRTLPPHEVTVGAFLIDRHEVSVAEYKRCVASKRCDAEGVEHEADGWRKGCNWDVAEREDHPMNCVSWKQARAYCVAIGGRLPSEAEWEFAARGSDGREYPWGNTFDPGRVAWGKEVRGTRPVDSYPDGASPFGLLHMSGNVWEWVEDVDEWRWVRGTLIHDPQSLPTYEGEHGRVIRGGGWTADPPSATLRHGQFPQTRGPDVGFRCAKSAR